MAYILLGIQSVAWFTHAKITRKNFTDETNRISQEKSELQNMLTNATFKSSDK